VEPEVAPVTLRGKGEARAVRFEVTAPGRVAPGRVEIQAQASRGPLRSVEAMTVVGPGHVEPRRLYRGAATSVLVADVKTWAGARVACVTATGDAVCDAVARLPVDSTLLAPAQLRSAKLDGFTTVVIGARAYEKPEVRAAHLRLMQYVHSGGHLVVLYQRVDFNQPGAAPVAGAPSTGVTPFAPFPASVSRARVTDERAAVRVLADGGVLAAPNRIGPVDWEGWVQERGLYFLDVRDRRYRDALAFTDPFPLNAGEKDGALVEAHVGKGTWTYVGLSLFRQLPAGVPGAWRLLANLVSRPRG